MRAEFDFRPHRLKAGRRNRSMMEMCYDLAILKKIILKVADRFAKLFRDFSLICDPGPQNQS